MKREKELAKKVHMDVLGFTDVSDIDDFGELSRRKALYGLCPFEEKDLEKRISITGFRPWAKTVVVFGLNYYWRPGPPPKSGEGKLALISRGEDYHRVLHRRGEALLRETGWKGEVFTDNHPLLERALAVRAGLGYIGKHTQLIHPVYGSYLALGLVLLEEELPPTERGPADSCGDCLKCVLACPGKALSPYSLNPGRCLSYVTQMKGEIPPHLEKRLGKRLYGCDTCQEVCPKNRKVPLTTHEEFVPVVENVSIEEVMALSNRQFKERFGHLCGAWRGKKCWVRNGEIILKNWKE